MQLDNPQFCTPSVEHAIDPQPLKVGKETPLIDAIALMSGMSVGGLSSKLTADGETDNQTDINHAVLACTPLGDCSTPTRSSCVLVMEGPCPIGIFTERDIVRLAANQTDTSAKTIADVMTSPVISLPLDGLRDIFAALFLFRRYSIRHLPIVDRNGHLVGVVSSDGLRNVLRPANLLKQRRVADVMTSDAIYAAPTSTVLVLAQMMAEHRVSCIIIADDRDAPDLNPVGIVTERDIVQFQALGLDLGRTPAQVVMSSPLTLLEPEDSLWEAHQKMQQLRVRRLVVSWNWGRGLGIVTQTSLLRVFDPMEMFGIIESLQQTVQQLEKEPPTVPVDESEEASTVPSEKGASEKGASEKGASEKAASEISLATDRHPPGDLHAVPSTSPGRGDRKSDALLQIQQGLQDLLETAHSQDHQQSRLRELLTLTEQTLANEDARKTFRKSARP